MAKKKTYSLIGVDGNAYCIMAYVTKAMEECGYDDNKVNEYIKDAESSDYRHLLAVSQVMIMNCNSK